MCSTERVLPPGSTLRTLGELAAARMGVDVALVGCRQLRVEHGPRTIHR